MTGLFTTANATALASLRIGLVVPQQSLRKSIQAVFARTPGLDASMVVSPFDVGKSDRPWDLLIVDEAHRLSQRRTRASAQKNREFHEINVKLFGVDDRSTTQLDWISEMSHQQLLLIDRRQRVRPADLDVSTLAALANDAEARGRRHVLTSQLRVASATTSSTVRDVLSPQPPSERIDFGDYDVRLFDDVGQMLTEVRARNSEEGLARVVAGYAWPWNSKKDKTRIDIVFDDNELRVEQPGRRLGRLAEVGRRGRLDPHDPGYDLNYAGVIIGRDLRYDEVAGELRFDRAHYFDKKGLQNNPGQKLTERELLDFVLNIYSVLMTRGIRGTYLYVVDDALRSYLRRYLG